MKKLFDRQNIKENKKYQYIIYGILFLILFIPNIFTVIYAADLEGNLKMKISYLVLSVLIWLMPLLFLSLKNYFRFGIVFILLSPLEIGFVKTTGSPINIGFIESIFNTDIRETKEQVFAHLPLIFSAIFVLFLYCYLLAFLNKKNLAIKGKIVLLSTFLVLNIALFFNMFSLQKSDMAGTDKLQFAWENTIRKYSKIYPSNIFTNTFTSWKTNIRNKKFEKKINNFTFNAREISKNKDLEIYILVIGETARKHNFHLYGYPRETTPELDSVKNLVPFTNANSAATLTLFSVPQIITRANPDHFDIQFKEKTILDVFHEANFFTAWIGTQTTPSPIIQRLEHVSDYHITLKADISSARFFDGDILPNVKKVIDDRLHKKKFIIIHSLGSHFRYSNRYPEKFEKFKPNISKNGYSNIDLAYKQELINSYDNSILYTDFFVASIIKEIEKANVIGGLIYLSDHGENLYDDGKTIFHGGEKPTHFEYEIPYLVWYSKKYEKIYPQKVEALKMNKDKKISSTTTFYSLADMANIRYKNSEKEIDRSIINLHYRAPQKRKMINSKKEIIVLD